MMNHRLLCLVCLLSLNLQLAEAAKPIRKLTYDADAPVVDLLSDDAKGKLQVQVIPQNEFLSRIRLENLTDQPLTVRLPKAVAAVHTIPKEKNPPRARVRDSETDPKDEEAPLPGTGQAVVGSFGPMNGPANAFPHQSEEGNALTIPAGRSVQIRLLSACAEHGKRSPISRMSYRLKPLDKQIEIETLRKVIQSYDPQTTDSLAFQAVVWHLANGLTWKALAGKTVKRGGQTVPYFTRKQLYSAQKLIADIDK